MEEINPFAEFSKTDQWMNIATELTRAARWQDDQNKFDGCMKRTFEMLDFMRKDQKWKGEEMILDVVRGEVQKIAQNKMPVEKLLAAI